MSVNVKEAFDNKKYFEMNDFHKIKTMQHHKNSSMSLLQKSTLNLIHCRFRRVIHMTNKFIVLYNMQV